MYQDGLTCWAWGYPGYCGPNAIVTPDNNLNFSYGSTYVYQQPWVASVLPNNGTGLIVRGYDFSFTAKNGNGWDDGRTDYLWALVRFWDTSGGRNLDNLLGRADYNLTYRFDWTQFNLSETWATPLSAGQIGQVQYGFLGQDSNGWAGPYGPEITNISFSLRYSVDPCVSDPLWSPTCSGYAQALLASLAPAAGSEPVIAVTVGESMLDSADVAELQTGPVAVETSQISLPDSAATTGRGTGADLNTVLGIVSAERDRVATLERATVNLAAESGQASIADTQQQAEAVASQASQDGQALSTQVADAAGGNLDSVADAARDVQTTGIRSLGSGLIPGRYVASAVPESLELVVLPPASGTVPRAGLDPVVPEITVNSSETELSLPAPRTGTVLESPDAVMPTQSTAMTVSAFTAVDVQASAQGQLSTGPAESAGLPPRPNVGTDALGSQDFAALAQAPRGFESYQRNMPDQPFYASREIYRNQTVVDNPRGRGLFGGTDRVHADMVQQQYQR